MRLPSLRFHKPSGQFCCTLKGKDHYLGKDLAVAREKYNRLMAEYLQSQPRSRTDLVTVEQLVSRHLLWCETYYQNGDSTTQTSRVASALKYVTDLYAQEPADQFGPLKLEASRDRMIAAGLSRTYINRLVDCIKRCWKWGVSKELVPQSTYGSLQAVAGLRKGRSAAKELPKVLPVPDDDFDALLPFCSPQVADMCRLQRLTGMRSGEMVKMTAAAIDRTDDVWLYTPPSHKTAHHGHDRPIFLGPKAQAILARYLERNQDGYLFVPRRRGGPPGKRFSTGTYGQAVRQAAKRRDKAVAQLELLAARLGTTVLARRIPHWFPHQLRHNAGTTVRAAYGLETSRAVLGQTTMQAAEIYAEADMDKAREAARKLG